MPFRYDSSSAPQTRNSGTGTATFAQDAVAAIRCNVHSRNRNGNMAWCLTCMFHFVTVLGFRNM